MHASLVYAIHREIPCVVKAKYRAGGPNERTTIRRTFSELFGDPCLRLLMHLPVKQMHP